jgi:hypothetical protein
MVLVATLASCGGSSAGPAGAVVGRVLSAPTCPVEMVGSPCPPRPVVGARVVATAGSHEVARTRTGAGGAFRLSLRPGTYLVTATNVGGYGSTAASSVDVRRRTTTTVTLTVDSGIR